MTFAALYDMRHRLSTYDFFTWLVHVQTLGATEIVIQSEKIISTKWSVAETEKRLRNYIYPGSALAGLPWRKGKDGRDVGSHMLQDLMALGKPYSFRRLTSVLPPAKERYTVTIRKTFHNRHKNSDEGVWREFAKEIGAHVIEDTATQTIGLYERMALYAGASMNFGVPNGPMTLCTYTPYPVTIFCDPVTSAKGMNGHGVKIGDNYPYALANQRLVWERATVEGLMREFQSGA